MSSYRLICIFSRADLQKTATKFILIGKIIKPHGLRGEVKIFPFSHDPASFIDHYSLLQLARDEQETKKFLSCRLENSRLQGKYVLTTLELCSDRNQAEQLSGFFVFARDCDLPELADDEFYLHELIGKPLIDKAGNLIGNVNRILEAGAQDLLVVQHQGREVLIPAVPDFIVAREDDHIVVDLPPGLLDL